MVLHRYGYKTVHHDIGQYWFINDVSTYSWTYLNLVFIVWRHVISDSLQYESHDDGPNANTGFKFYKIIILCAFVDEASLNDVTLKQWRKVHNNLKDRTSKGDKGGGGRRDLKNIETWVISHIDNPIIMIYYELTKY